MGEGAETQAHDLGSGPKEDRGGTAGEVGAGEGAAEEDFLEPETTYRLIDKHESPTLH